MFFTVVTICDSSQMKLSSSLKTFYLFAYSLLICARTNTAFSLQLSAQSMGPASKISPKIAVIGAGAAGLVTARVLSRNGIEAVVFEKNSSPGGVWNYVANSSECPMYRGLRTNLPKELMAYKEKRWGSDGVGMSFVTHEDVNKYLYEYATEFDLHKLISFGSKITQLTVPSGDFDRKNGENYPSSLSRITLQWETDDNNSDENSRRGSSCFEDIFDAVIICNGHYALPSSPGIPGLEYFKGRVIHSIQYDTPSDFADQVVLCVGGRASGSDLAREISEYAKHVYLSDSTFPFQLDKDTAEKSSMKLGNVDWVPRTEYIDSKSCIYFGDECEKCPNDVDVIIFCTGYDYNFPFINDKSNLELSVVPGERRVTPLFEQLWHAKEPSISFIGLQHSVVPFPFFELQAEAVVSQILGSAPNPLPDKHKRILAAEKDSNSGGPCDTNRVQDTHYLGNFQWDSQRRYAQLAGIYNNEWEDYISTSRAIYDHSSQQRKGVFPSSPDTYRYNVYVRDEQSQSFTVRPI